MALLAGCSVTGSLFNGDRTTYLYKHQRYHTVEKGETLYSIAWTYGYDYKTVAGWNKINPPYIISLGQRIRVAPPPEVLTSRTDQNSAKEKAWSGNSKKGNWSQKKSKKIVKNRTENDETISWQWPVRGKVIDTFSASDRGVKGVNISGPLNREIHSAASGEVVYSGTGLRGYGRLVIIKHDNIFLSAYAHNNKLLVKEGERVKQGQKIATMGSSGTDKVMLHFEIRKDGRPVDPLRYLPKRSL
ncbi:MAG: peptidoglycan DD-metalloendopeptidase family protein [Gammaproteobacteria bacterium]|nr:peptidoglycan DD-metalloendopeptidase family protein [Gammaproteobacteria bacterium]